MLLAAHPQQLRINRHQAVGPGRQHPRRCPCPGAAKAGRDVVSDPERCGRLSEAPATSPASGVPARPGPVPHSLLQPRPHPFPPRPRRGQTRAAGGKWLWRLSTSCKTQSSRPRPGGHQGASLAGPGAAGPALSSPKSALTLDGEKSQVQDQKPLSCGEGGGPARTQRRPGSSVPLSPQWPRRLGTGAALGATPQAQGPGRTPLPHPS